jgi:hypothetical protein
MISRIAVAAVGLLAVGCCRSESHATTPQFPDFSKYAPVDVADYRVDSSSPGHPGTQVVFLTPDGITCAFSTPASAGCAGNTFPAVSAAESGVNSIGTDTPMDTTNAPIAHGRTTKTLPPFHTITVDGVVCGVDDARTTACKDTRGRGFVLSPNGSGWLPHV